MSSFEVVSHKAEVGRQIMSKLKQAATMIGGTVEGHAKERCPVDTGLLRNSITYAIGGQPVNTPEYKSNDVDKNKNKIEVQTGAYTAQAPADEDGQITVYVGTNVHYAPHQELGAPTINLPARPFLRPAFENHKDEIEQILKKTLGSIR